MPRFLHPKKSIQHRVAAIALYRALLTRCSSAPLRDEDQTSLRNAIRNSFRKNRKIQSPRQLGLVFRAGYEILDRLNTSKTGDAQSVQSIATLVSTLPKRLKASPPVGGPPPPSTDEPKESLRCLPPERAILNVRPYAKVSGPRHVPILASANGIPFLRLTKPQPPALSRIIQQKLKARINRFDLRILLNNYWLPLSKYEDQWDALLRKECGLKEGSGLEKEPRWAEMIHEAAKANVEKYERDLAKDREIAARMMKIVDEETKLAIAEGQKVVRGRKGRPVQSRRLMK